MNKITALVLVVIATFAACTQKEMKTGNLLLDKFETPFGVPPFDKIKISDFKPAIEKGVQMQMDEVVAIAENTAAPDFENTIVALDNCGESLYNAIAIFYNINEANTNDSIQAIATEIAPMLSKLSDDIYMNSKLFGRIKAIYDKQSDLSLSQEQKKLLEKTYKNFIRGGAGLDSASQSKLRKINSDLDLLALKFGENMLAETNGFKLILDAEADLAGLPKGIIDAASEDAKSAGKEGKWLFSLHNPSIMPFLQYASNRKLREKIWNAYQLRGNNNNKNDNKEVIGKIVSLRIQKANLLGYDTHAAYKLDECMAKNPENVYKLLNEVWNPALNRAKSELSDMQSLIDKEKGNFKLAVWDWRYYAEKVRKEKYDLDEEQLRPYFKLENVRDGVFDVAKKLYGLTFEEIKNIPKYHPDAVAYEVKNANGSHQAVLYLDFFPRESKRGGAWMTSYRDQYKKGGKNISPVISLVCNFTKPTADSPSLLTVDEVETFFHEFGHALHGMLSNCTYRSLSGTNVARDFVELPSQIMENWAVEPSVLKVYAKHYKTGEEFPDALIAKMENSKYFNQGFATVEYLAASFLDMDYHTVKDTSAIDVLQFEKQSLDSIKLIPEIISRYRSTYFNHVFGSSGYSAGYYSYLWAEVLDADAFDYFKTNGIFDPKTADLFRKNILEKGGTDDPMVLYKNFRGSEPQITPLLKRRGLL